MCKIKWQFEPILPSDTHNRALPEDVKMYLIKVTTRPSAVLCRTDAGDNVFWKRRNGRAVPFFANELRQLIAESLTSGPQVKAQEQVHERGPPKLVPISEKLGLTQMGP